MEQGARLGAWSARGRGSQLTRLLFDTTFLIDAERAGAELDELIGDDDDVAISAITVAELEVGVEMASGRSRRDREGFVTDVIATVPFLSYDIDVARAHASLLVAVRRQGRARGAHDLIIAATARATSRTVLTADEAAFDALPNVAVRLHR
jgi:tRNA(fMet)-specific endonuclease VapC